MTDGTESDRSLAPGRASSQRRTAGLLVRIVYGTCTALVLLGALFLFVKAGAVRAQHQENLEERAQDGYEAQARTTGAQEDLEDLPTSDEAQRWLAQATTVGEDIAEAQNTYLEHSGPLNTEGLPGQTPALGESNECAPYVDALPRQERDYTEEEHLTCAEGLRESAVGDLERKLQPHFTEGAQDSEGFNAVSRWHSLVPILEGEESLSAYTWAAHQAQVFEQDAHIRMVWTLTEDDTGRPLAWLRGQYDPVINKFDNLVLGVVDHAEDQDEEPEDD